MLRHATSCHSVHKPCQNQKSHQCPEAAQTGSAPEGNRLVKLIRFGASGPACRLPPAPPSRAGYSMATGTAPRILMQNVFKHPHTGRIPEGHRKGNKSLVKGHSGQSCNKTCMPEGYRKDTGRESGRIRVWYGVTVIRS